MSVSFRYRIEKARPRRIRFRRVVVSAGQPLLCTIGPAVRAQNV